MPSEVSHDEWVRRTRHQKNIIDRQQEILRDLRADLAAIQRRIDRALNYSTSKTTDRKGN
ncbi:hypothetical protein [Curtobacterium flaccumfaciens]|uniref:hypothetical protein n=1 Tax=Curtobacterium flaccumfaciens TaxID=2035 RepID=UPI003996067C